MVEKLRLNITDIPRNDGVISRYVKQSAVFPPSNSLTWLILLGQGKILEILPHS